MKGGLFDSIVRRLMRTPAVAFHEHAVRAVVAQICREHGLTAETDAFGNTLIEVRRGRGARPMVMVAHLDHPGFEIVSQSAPKTYTAEFLGGVPDRYFQKGTALRLLPGATSATLGRCLDGKRAFEIFAFDEVKEAPRYAVWELSDVAIRRGKIVGRACDDLVGVAAVLAVLIELKHSRRHVWVQGAITRAEEIGFGGALSLARSCRLAGSSLVISLETSKELPGVRMGEGVIVRVGDRSSVFDSSATRYFHELGLELATQDRAFKVQRALMGGGSCEGTVFQESGFQTAALCVALGNYHNCGPEQIAEEFVSRSDALSMVRLLVVAALQLRHFARVTDRLPRRLERIRQRTARKLRRSAGTLSRRS